MGDLINMTEFEKKFSEIGLTYDDILLKVQYCRGALFSGYKYDRFLHSYTIEYHLMAKGGFSCSGSSYKKFYCSVLGFLYLGHKHSDSPYLFIIPDK